MQKSLFDYWDNKELPEDVQKRVDEFATATQKGKTEQIFRAGFWIGLNHKQILKELNIETK